MRAFIAEGQRVFNRLAALKIPTVAAIHGACAGGGYEVTLACDYRRRVGRRRRRELVCRKRRWAWSRPGAARRGSPRMIGPEKAAEVILKGKLHSAQEALQLGLVDEVVPPDKLPAAAREKLQAGKRSQGNASAAANLESKFRAPRIAARRHALPKSSIAA